MSIIAAARDQAGYALAHEEGEAFWLLGMLQTIKVGRADTNGQFGMLEIVVPAGLGSPWHVHPEEDEWFHVLDGQLTFYVGDGRHRYFRRCTTLSSVDGRRAVRKPTIVLGGSILAQLRDG